MAFKRRLKLSEGRRIDMWGRWKAGFVTRPQGLRASLQTPFLGRSRVYCLPATMTLLTVCPCAFLSVWVAVSLLLSAEIATLVMTVTLPPTLPTTS